MPLTDLECRNAAPADRPYKLSDAKGLHLLVQPSGSKLWRLAYRFGGKQKTMALGAYPYVKLPRARELRDAARDQLQQVIDPMAVRREAKAAAVRAAGNTFREIAEQQHAMWKVGKDPAHVARVWSRLERDAFPVIGLRPITDIKPPEVLAMIRKVEARGALDISKRLKQKVSEIFQFAIASGLCEMNPAADIGRALKPRPRVQHMAKIAASDLPALLGRLARYEGDELTRLAIKFTLLTWARTSEVRLAPRSKEFEGLDGSEPLWRIPPERMKKHREHLVPLSRQAVAVIRRLWEIRKSEYLFPHDRKHWLPASQNMMISACYRMGYRGRLTIHGLRGTASTWANERLQANGRHYYEKDWIEMALAHADDDEVRSAYNSAVYLGPRRKMLQDWADFVEDAERRGIAAALRPVDEFDELLAG